MSSESSSRSRQFKNQGRGTEDGRRKRADASLELRKLKKEDQLMKRRNVCEAEAEEPTSPLQERSANVTSPQGTALSMDDITKYMKGDDSEKRLIAVQASRKILSKERNPPIDDFIQAGLVPILVQFLESPDSSLQFESAWALTNIASGNSEQTAAVAKAGAVPKFIKLLKSSEENVCEQAVWALGNIAGDGPHLRDLVIESGAIEPLLALVRPHIKITFLRNVAWTLSNLCRNKNPAPDFKACCRCLPVFCRLLLHNDPEILGDTCWALSYITDGTNEKIQAVLDAGILPTIVRMLYHEDAVVVTPALRTVGNIVTGDDDQTQAVVNEPGSLQALCGLLDHTKANIKKEAAWAISNITAGNQAQIQAVIDAQILPGVVDLMKNGDFKSQKEAAWVITNLTSGGNVNQTAYAVDQGCLPPLLDLMVAKDPRTVRVVLDAINNILLAARNHSPEAKDRLCLLIEELGGLDKIEALQDHENTDIYHFAQRLIEEFFSEEADTDDALAPTQQSDQFQFSQPSHSQDSSAAGASKFNF